jgi:serine/threonine protein kinase
MIGKTLAHYEITSRLGKGGMGEVFQAKDQKLGRNVAIKVLPEEFAKNIDRVARSSGGACMLYSRLSSMLILKSSNICPRRMASDSYWRCRIHGA